MLSPADAALVRRERRLPGLAVLLDPEEIGAALQRALPDAGIRGATIRYLRYKPQTSCLAAGTLRSERGEVLFYAISRRTDANDKLEKVRRPSSRASLLGPARFVLDPCIAVHIFPDDRGIRGLRSIGSATRFEALIREVLPNGEMAEALSARTLRYKPERRWVGALEGGDSRPIGVLRLYSPEGYEAARRNATAFRSRGELRIARLLGATETVHALALEWLTGASPGDDAGDLERTGEALANLHRQDGVSLAQPTLRGLRAQVTDAAAAVGATCPELSRSAANLAQRIAARLDADVGARVNLHGDFHAGQVLLGTDAVGLLDFDRAAGGDPASDFGTFLAELQAAAGAPSADAAQESLLAGYRRAGGAPPTARRLDLHRAAALLRIAPHFFRRRDASWREHTAALLERARQVLDAPPRRRVSADPDPGIPFLARALDTRAAEQALRALPALSSADLHVVKARVLRHKPGRRCLVEYELRSGHKTLVVLGKVRAKGSDERAHRAEAALRESGVPIPESLGLVPELGMRVQRKAPGIPATSLLSSTRGAALARSIAEALHGVHCSPVRPVRRHTVDDELRILETRLLQAARARPAWASRIQELFRTCAGLAAELEGAPEAPIHRDFYPDQVLVDGGRLWLVDFDLFCKGDPALDAGNFSAHVTERAIRFPAEKRALDRAAAAFEERFVELSGEDARPRVRIHAVLSLARHVSLSLEIPGRAPFTGAVLDTCERVTASNPIVVARRQLAAGGDRS